MTQEKKNPKRRKKEKKNVYLEGLVVSFLSCFLIIISSKRLNSFIRPIDGILTSSTTLSQSGPGSNGNERVFQIFQSPKTGYHTIRCCLVSYPGHSLCRGRVSLCRDKVSIFYSPSPKNEGETERMHIGRMYTLTTKKKNYFLLTVL